MYLSAANYATCRASKNSPADHRLSESFFGGLATTVVQKVQINDWRKRRFDGFGAEEVITLPLLEIVGQRTRGVGWERSWW